MKLTSLKQLAQPFYHQRLFHPYITGSSRHPRYDWLKATSYVLGIPASFDQRWSERLTNIVFIKFARPPRPALVFHLQNCAFESKLKFWPRITATGKESELFVEAIVN